MRDLAASIEAAGNQVAEGAVKIADDLARYQILLDRVQPAVIIETGTFTGMSARWFANHSPAGTRIVSVDYDEPPRVLPLIVDDPRITLVRGNSTAPVTIATVHDIVGDSAPVFVSLDADHGTDSVLAELEAYSSLVTVGSYIVVEDTICRWLTGPIVAPYIGTPYDAVDRWLPLHPEFVADMEIEEAFPCTQSPGGWLRRIS